MSSRKVVAGTYLQGRSHRHRPPYTIAKPNPNPIPNPNPNQVVCFGLKDGTDLSSKLKRAQVTPTLTLTLTLTLTTDPNPEPNEHQAGRSSPRSSRAYLAPSPRRSAAVVVAAAAPTPTGWAVPWCWATTMSSPTTPSA